MVGQLHTLWHHPTSKKEQLFQGLDKKEESERFLGWQQTAVVDKIPAAY